MTRFASRKGWTPSWLTQSLQACLYAILLALSTLRRTWMALGRPSELARLRDMVCRSVAA